MPEKFEGGASPQEHKEGEPKVKYQLLYNEGAGRYYVNEWTQEELDDENSSYRTQVGYYIETGLYDSKEELEKAIEELRGEPVWAVFEDVGADKIYYSKEDNLTGNWAGGREGHANLVQTFKTEGEAKEHKRQLEEHYAKLEEEGER